MELDHPVDVFVFRWPWEGGDRVAERDAAVESGPEVGGSGERVYVIGQATGHDREKIDRRLRPPDGTVANGDGYAIADPGREKNAEDPAALTREAKVAVAVVPQRIHRFCQVNDRRTMQC